MRTSSTYSAFIARALASRDEAKLSGEYFASAEVHAELESMLAESESDIELRRSQRDTHR